MPQLKIKSSLRPCSLSRLLVVSIDFRGREMACLAAALGPLACLAAALCPYPAFRYPDVRYPLDEIHPSYI